MSVNYILGLAGAGNRGRHLGSGTSSTSDVTPLTLAPTYMSPAQPTLAFTDPSQGDEHGRLIHQLKLGSDRRLMTSGKTG